MWENGGGKIKLDHVKLIDGAGSRDSALSVVAQRVRKDSNSLVGMWIRR